MKRATPSALLAAMLLTGCAMPVTVPGPAPVEQVKVPASYMPPSGKCRIWHRDREPDQQPPVGECSQLRQNVPADAVLVNG
jgi:hypothetical protein